MQKVAAILHACILWVYVLYGMDTDNSLSTHKRQDTQCHVMRSTCKDGYRTHNMHRV